MGAGKRIFTGPVAKRIASGWQGPQRSPSAMSLERWRRRAPARRRTLISPSSKTPSSGDGLRCLLVRRRQCQTKPAAHYADGFETSVLTDFPSVPNPIVAGSQIQGQSRQQDAAASPLTFEVASLERLCAGVERHSIRPLEPPGPPGSLPGKSKNLTRPSRRNTSRM